MNTTTTYRKKIKSSESKDNQSPSEGTENHSNTNKKKSLKIWLGILIVAAIILIAIIVGVIILKNVGGNKDKKEEPNILKDNQDTQDGNIDNNDNTGNSGNTGNTENTGNTGNNALSKKEALTAFESDFKVSSKINNLNQVLMKSNLKHTSISNGVESTTLSIFTKTKFDLYTLNESYAGEDNKDFYSKKFITVITINSMCTVFSGSKTDCELEQYLDLNVKSKNLRSIDEEEVQEVIKEAKSLPTSVTEEEIKDRKDLRDEVILTLDCDGTKDRDDAVGVKKLPNGNYLLKVNISHVSHYVTKESKSFEEALRRTSSHYPLHFCIPMLHHIISNGICSLHGGVDRLTRTVEMEFNSLGEVVNYDIYKSVINSKKAMTYSEGNDILNNPNSTFKYKYDLNLMRELNIILERAKNKRNYINFDVEETHIVQDANNNITGFTPTDHGECGKIIENFMLVANETVYKHFAWFILAYRVHEVPDQDKVNEMLNLLRESCIKVPKLNNVSSAALKNLINNLDTSEVSQIIKSYLLKSQKKARYDTVNVGHFALQYMTYGHFTSPIRRIMDLIMHMTIDNIEKFDYSEDSIKEFEKFLNEVCERTNRIEKIDRQVNEECMEMEMAHYMENHIGEEYEVYVTEIGRHSMLVKTTDHIRGKIKLENMEDDKYYYDNDKKAIIGKHNKRKYQIGNHFIALVKDACKETRTVNFEIPKQLVKKMS